MPKQEVGSRAAQLMRIGAEIRDLFVHYSPLPELSPAQFQILRLLYQAGERGVPGCCPPFAAHTAAAAGFPCGAGGTARAVPPGETGLRITALARLLGNTPPTVSQHADELERRGYLARRRSAGDRRAVCLELTPQGRALMERAMELYDHLGRRLVARLGDEQFDTFLLTLNNLKNALVAEQAEFAAALAAGQTHPSKEDRP